ncbi:MAG: alpha/beta hydrolase [Neisseria sp.]
MSLLPQVQQFLDVLNHQITPFLQAQGFTVNAINAREALAGLTFQHVTRKQEVAQVLDDTVASLDGGYAVPLRIYHPNPQQALPVLVYFHGGGGVVGSVSIYDQICRRIADATQYIVVAPEYRLAPENPYPAAQDDALTVIQNIEALLAAKDILFTPRFAIGGDSAGGALCTNLLRSDHEVRGDIIAQVLVYPSVDFTMTLPSVTTYGEGYLLTAERMHWYFAQYLHGHEDHREASSLYNPLPDDMPPTLVISAIYDPLYDEGRAYVDKVIAAGFEAEHLEIDGVVHAFLNMEDLCPEQCAQTYAAMGEFLAKQV